MHKFVRSESWKRQSREASRIAVQVGSSVLQGWINVARIRPTQLVKLWKGRGWGTATQTRRISSSSAVQQQSAVSDTMNPLYDTNVIFTLNRQSSPKIFAPLLFTVAVGASSFGLAHYIRLHRAEMQEKWKSLKRNWLPSFMTQSASSSGVRIPVLGSDGRIHSTAAPREGFLGFVDQTIAGARAQFQELSPGKSAVLAVLSFNAALFLAWRIPSRAVKTFMAKHFLHGAYSGKSYTLLTSAFFHMELWHFAVNAFAMWGFGDIAHFLMGPEYFAATTVTAAATSSLSHHLWSALLRNRNPGLGASGFVCTYVALTALVFPTAKSLLFFVVPVPMDKMLMGLVAFDTIGLFGIWTLLFGWHIGHAAHLGGVASGWVLFQLLNASNRQYIRNRMPPELVQLYDRYHKKIFG